MMTKSLKIFSLLIWCLQIPSACIHSSWFSSVKVQTLRVFASDETRVALQFARNQGSVTKAKRKLIGLIKKEPKELRYRLTLARLYLMDGSLKKAENLAKSVEKLQYRNLQAKLILANVAYMQGRNLKAKLILTSLGNLNRVSNSAKTEIYNLLAGVALRQNKDQESIDLLKKVLSINKRFPAAHMNLGLVYLKHQEYDLAKTHFKAILSIFPKNEIASLHLGICYAGAGDYDQADKLYDLVEERRPSLYTVYFNRAVLEFRRKNYSESIDYLREYVDRAPVKYLARRAASRIINEIQLANVHSKGISEDDIEDLIAQVEASDDYDSPNESLSHESASELNIGFVFTSVGYVND